jgi:hypothetical protein
MPSQTSGGKAPHPEARGSMSMKVNVSVEATAQEMREFLGLPNIQPLHDDILQTMRDNVQRGVISFDAFNHSSSRCYPRNSTRWKWCRSSGKRSPRPAAQPTRSAERKSDSPRRATMAVRNGAEKSA